jgi:hypothetical protein
VRLWPSDRLAVVTPFQTRYAGIGRSFAAFSPFVLGAHDSESSHADPSGTSLALSDRLARDQPDRTLRTCKWSLRTLRTAAWPTRCSAQGCERGLVGRRRAFLAGWTRPRVATASRFCCSRRDLHHAQTGLPGHSASQSRSEFQRSALAKPRRPLSALPHDPRCARTSSPSVVESLSTPRARRPLHRTLRLASRPRAFMRRRRARTRSVPFSLWLFARRPEARATMTLRFEVTGVSGNDRSPARCRSSADA